ncbi:MAG: YqgE/AlgH family protein [Gammaproteobacteria bacterium]|nr:YqgE/AlgH family protein [Gammaproteobacteria bacterium]
MTESHYLTGHFLIAMPALNDPNFFHSVAYICEHNDEGAMGLVINRPMSVSVGEVLSQLGFAWPSQEIADQIVMQGGPVETERGFVIHTPIGEWNATMEVTEEIGVSSSRDILEAIGRGEGPDRMLVALGYAGWGPGQLETEMAANTWLSVPALADIIFDTPHEKRWEEAARSVGVDLNLLSNDVGHA